VINLSEESHYVGWEGRKVGSTALTALTALTLGAHGAYVQDIVEDIEPQ